MGKKTPFSSGAKLSPDSLQPSPGSLRHRKKSPDTELVDSSENDLNDIIKQTSSLSIREKVPENTSSWPYIFKNYVNPLILTALSAFVRLHRIGSNTKVVWDEAHFGKFGSHYLKHEFYTDVHPPMGKLLVGLSGYLAGYDGSFKFESGMPFPNNVDFVTMRVFNCLFGIMCTPLAYFTAVEMGFSQWTVWFVSLLVVFEMLSLTLSKFILLDSMLLFFTVAAFYCLVKVHLLRFELLTQRGFAWLALTGVSIGCVCSVKWVGLFVTALVGFYTIYDLILRFYQTIAPASMKDVKMSWQQYALHWALRVFCLIFIPFCIYVLAFKVHFAVLTKSGPGDGSISTLLQASLDGNQIMNGPRSVAYGSMVTLRSQGLSPNLIHSHGHSYPEGSRQQQVTTYGYKDNNNEFLIEFDMQTTRNGKYATLEFDEDSPENVLDYTTLVKDGDTVRFMHRETGCFLHSHSIAAPVLKSQFEASCYGGLDVHDEKDEWVIEVQTQDVSPNPRFHGEDALEIHPVSTNFRLRHKVLGCYLATTGYSYPAWGFQQGEVVCKKYFLAKDKSTWWNIEDHANDKLQKPAYSYTPPEPKFWKEFVLLNYGMMASNNALVPDPDHFDSIASVWWEWPILRTGLRMSSWSAEESKYFLMGHPFVTFFSTLCIPIAVVTVLVTLFQWQRQKVDLDVFGEQWSFLLCAGGFPLLGWLLHYSPFIMMGRVTYLHHYVPALYFAIFVSGYVVEFFVARKLSKYPKYAVFALLFIGVVGGFWHYRHLSLGMRGPTRDFQHLQLFKSWNF